MQKDLKTMGMELTQLKGNTFNGNDSRRNDDDNDEEIEELKGKLEDLER